MQQTRRKIAVVGGGVAGLSAARRLDADHDVVVFEAADYAGGHTRTLDVEHEGRDYVVDIGFIVFNDWTYPNFIAMLDELGVESRPSEMSFSVRDDASGLEYQGGGVNGLFARRTNALRPSFWRMLLDVRRFFRSGKSDVDHLEPGVTLGDYLRDGGYGDGFVRRFIIPMGAAIWSTEPRRMLDFPAASFLRFFRNHGLLNYRDRPQWRTLVGGSRSYVQKLLARLDGELRLSTPVQGVKRLPDSVIVHAEGRAAEHFDYVVFACHSDQALALLDAPNDDERRVLGAIPYQDNEVVLHTDASLLPRRRRAWASWNYHLTAEEQPRATLTYNMNILQGLVSREPLCVTLNSTASIDPDRVLHVTTMAHPLYTSQGIRAQAEVAEINGAQRSFYCGAWCGYGFHEDGVVSGLRAAEALLERIDDEQLLVQRAN